MQLGRVATPGGVGVEHFTLHEEGIGVEHGVVAHVEGAHRTAHLDDGGAPIAGGDLELDS